MTRSTPGRLAVEEALPEDLRDFGPLDKKGVAALLNKVAANYPERYAEISHRISDIGRRAATEFGGYSFGLEHLKKTEAAKRHEVELRGEYKQILDDDTLSDAQRHERILTATKRHQKPQTDEGYAEAIKANNPLAMQVLSGSRGSPANLNSLIGSDLLYSDHMDRPQPLPIFNGYAHGLSPVEYWTGMYGARKGIVDTKMAIARAGFLGKVLAQVSHRQVVTGHDSETADPDRGLPVSVTDHDSVGGLLARATAGYPRDTVLTSKILAHLKAKGNARILVRSPTVGGSPDGGVYAKDVGMREYGVLPGLGSQVGMTAAQALAEPVSQGTLGSKHCLMRGTLVRMADWSVKAIERIKPGDWVLGADLNRMTFPVRVLRRFDNGMRDCYLTTFSPAYRCDEETTVASTLDHNMLCSRQVSGQRDAYLNYVPQMLPIGKVGRCFYAHPPVGTVDREEWTQEPMAKLIGLLTGDGCYTESVNGVHLSCYDPSLIDMVSDELAALNIKLVKLEGHKGYYRVSQIDEVPAERTTIGQFKPGARNPAKRWLEVRGMMHKYAHEKTTPPEIDNWDNATILDYLAGLFAADGSWYFANVENKGDMHFSLGMTARPIIEKVKELLATRFGVYAGKISVACKDAAAPGGIRRHPMHKIVIAQAGQVRRLTGLVIHKLVGIKRKTTEAAMRFTAKGYDEYRLVRRTQTKIGRRPTYDLSVDHPDHLFVLANGLIVANSGGVTGQGKVISGFDYINRLIQVPSQFAGGAAHAGNDGLITGIEDAPAGGKHVWVDQERHHVPVGADVSVKRGQKVEAGDLLSTGQPDPAQWVAHKGIGEGRRFFTDLFTKTLADTGVKGHRRNVELLARGLINHVRLTDEFYGHGPGEIIPYSTLERLWEPREGHRTVAPKRALGSYLEKPILHYSIGTKVRPSVARDLEEFGIKEVTTHHEPPPFEAQMVRGMDSLKHDPDWQVKMYGSGLKSSLLESVRRGGVSDEAGTSFVPALAGGVNFGKVGPVHQPEPGVSEADMAKHKPHLGTLTLPDPPTRPTVSRLSSFLKMSADEAAELREARALVKRAVDATHQSELTGSSTTNTQGITDKPGGAAGKDPTKPQAPPTAPEPTPPPMPSYGPRSFSTPASGPNSLSEASAPAPDPTRVNGQRQAILRQALAPVGLLANIIPGGGEAWRGLTAGPPGGDQPGNAQPNGTQSIGGQGESSGQPEAVQPGFWSQAGKAVGTVGTAIATNQGPRIVAEVAGNAALRKSVAPGVDRVAGNAAVRAGTQQAVERLGLGTATRKAIGLGGGLLSAPIDLALELTNATIGLPKPLGGEGFGNPVAMGGPESQAATTPDGQIFGQDDPSGGALSYLGAAFNSKQNWGGGAKNIVYDAPKEIGSAIDAQSWSVAAEQARNAERAYTPNTQAPGKDRTFETYQHFPTVGSYFNPGNYADYLADAGLKGVGAVQREFASPYAGPRLGSTYPQQRDAFHADPANQAKAEKLRAYLATPEGQKALQELHGNMSTEFADPTRFFAPKTP